MGVSIIKVLVVLGAFLGPCSASGHEQMEKPPHKPAPSTTAALLLSRGYIAVDHDIGVQNGNYTLNLVQAKNPLINGGKGVLKNKDPILFIHGIVTNANAFIYLNDGVRPMNYSAYDINGSTIKNLHKLLGKDPGSRSLVFTALNFGHEVWLLNRRPTIESFRVTHTERAKRNNYEEEGERQRLIDSGNFANQTDNYWNFSFDEQAKYDIPETIDYILKTTGKQKLITVGYSAGVTITLMALTNKPKLANKISKALFWAPSFDLGSGLWGGELDALLMNRIPSISKIMGPFPEQSTSSVVQAYSTVACGFRWLRPDFCDPKMNFLLGKGAEQLESQHLNVKNDWFDTTSRFELAQYAQSMKKGKMYHFDYLDEKKNRIAYGQSTPPIYDISKITLNKMSFWIGNTDKLASVRNFDLTKRRLSVPFNQQVIGGNGIFFNHFGFALHGDVTKLLIIPSLKTIGS